MAQRYINARFAHSFVCSDAVAANRWRRFSSISTLWYCFAAPNVNLVHSHRFSLAGINVRYLGLMRRLLGTRGDERVSRIRSLILTEMISRVCKNYLRSRLREVRSADLQAYHTVKTRSVVPNSSFFLTRIGDCQCFQFGVGCWQRKRRVLVESNSNIATVEIRSLFLATTSTTCKKKKIEICLTFFVFARKVNDQIRTICARKSRKQLFSCVCKKRTFLKLAALLFLQSTLQMWRSICAAWIGSIAHVSAD